MVRGKTQMKRIENTAKRQVMFSKRRGGLLKKAYELLLLCDAEVAVIVFSSSGHLFEFASNSLQKTIDRYMTCKKRNDNDKIADQVIQEQAKNDTICLAKELEALEDSKRIILGENLKGCSVEELQSLEIKVEKNLKHIREKKTKLLEQQIAMLKQKERVLLKDNQDLREKKCSFQAPLSMAPVQLQDVPQATDNCGDVVTELYIGLPSSVPHPTSSRQVQLISGVKNSEFGGFI